MTAWQQFEHYPAEARLSRPGLRHDEMLGCLVEVFGRHDSVWVSGWLDEASRALFGVERLTLSDQATALTELLGYTLGLEPEPKDHRSLLLDHAARWGAAHPVLLATLGHELGRRAGLDVHVCTANRAWWTVLMGDDACVLVGSGEPPPDTQVQMRLRCPHQVAFVTLTQLVRLGPPEVRGPAKRLIRALPACDGNRDA